MGHQDECLVDLLVQLSEQIVYELRGFGVQVSSQLIAYDDGGIIGQGPGNCYPLVLAAG